MGLTPCADRARIPGVADIVNDVVLCSAELAFICYSTGAPGPVDWIAAVNPLTGKTLRTYPLTDPSAPVFSFGSRFGLAYGNLERIDANTAGYSVFVPEPNGLNGSFVSGGVTTPVIGEDTYCYFGTVTVAGMKNHRHRLQHTNHVVDGSGAQYNLGEHFKDTGMTLWVDQDSHHLTAMYFSDYHYYTSGFDTKFSATAWAVEVNPFTGAVSEYQVNPNMGPDSDTRLLPQYYGTLAIGKGRAYGIRGYNADVTDPFGFIETMRVGYEVLDNTGRVVHRTNLQKLPGNTWETQLFAGAAYLYNIGQTGLMGLATEVDTAQGIENGGYVYFQKFSVDPEFEVLGAAQALNLEFLTGGNFPFEDLMFATVTDCGDIFAGHFRVGNTPYGQSDNHRSNTSFAIGVQDLVTSEITLATIEMGYRNNPLRTASVDAYASGLTGDGRDLILYAWRFAPYAGGTPGTAVFFQLWSAGESPLRLNQRHDGAGMFEHPRLAATQAPKAPRVGFKHIVY